MSPFRIVAVLPLLAALATAELATLAAESAAALREIAREATTAFRAAQDSATHDSATHDSDTHDSDTHDIDIDTDDIDIHDIDTHDGHGHGGDDGDGDGDGDGGDDDSDDGDSDDSDSDDSDSDDGGLAEMQPAALTLTGSNELATAMKRLGDALAGRNELMQRLNLCNDDGGATDAVVVCALARAVHTVLMHFPRRDEEGRPAALAALLRWDSLGVVSGPSDSLGVVRVDAGDVRGVSLLLGRHGPYAVDGIAAFAFRALETCAGDARWRQVIEAGGELEAGAVGEPVAVAKWSRLTADAAGDALSAPAARCLLLLFGSTKHGHDVARAAATAPEVELCRFAVRGHAALRALGALRDYSASEYSASDRFVAAQNAADQVIKRGNFAVLVGPVMADLMADARATDSDSAEVQLGSAARFVSLLLSAGLRAHESVQPAQEIVQPAQNQRYEHFEEPVTGDHSSFTEALYRMLVSSDEAGDAFNAEELLSTSAKAAAAEQAERVLGARVQIGAFEQVAQGPVEGMDIEDMEVARRLLAIFGGDVQQPGAAAEPTAEPAEMCPSCPLKELMDRLKAVMNGISSRIEDERELHRRQWQKLLLDPTSGTEEGESNSGAPQTGGAVAKKLRVPKAKKLRVPKGNRLLGVQ